MQNLRKESKQKKVTIFARHNRKIEGGRLGQRFQVVIHFHPGHSWPKPLINYFTAPV